LTAKQNLVIIFEAEEGRLPIWGNTKCEIVFSE
jgi:hypothetical protein